MKYEDLTEHYFTPSRDQSLSEHNTDVTVQSQ